MCCGQVSRAPGDGEVCSVCCGHIKISHPSVRIRQHLVPSSPSLPVLASFSEHSEHAPWACNYFCISWSISQADAYFTLRETRNTKYRRKHEQYEHYGGCDVLSSLTSFHSCRGPILTFNTEHSSDMQRKIVFPVPSQRSVSLDF